MKSAMLEIELYCSPSGNMVFAAPGQLTPAYMTLLPDAESMSRPETVKGVSGHVECLCGAASMQGKLMRVVEMKERIFIVVDVLIVER